MKLVAGLIFMLLCLVCQINSQYAVVDKEITNTSIKLFLKYTGNLEYYIKEKSKIVKNLTFQLRTYNYLEFCFKIYDTNNKRYEVPQGGIFPKDPVADYSYPLNFSDIRLTYTENPFTFKLVRQINGMVIFDSSVTEFIYSEYFIQIGTTTTSETLYGFSERFSKNFRLKPGKWTMFPRDRGQQMDFGTGKQTHGYYPIYLERDPTKRYHISYFRSSNALDVIAQQQKDKYKLTYKAIGGIIDFRIFLGMVMPQNLLNLLYNYIGTSAIPPFWALGFHQCRWGYKNVQALENVISQYKKNGIPLDTIWTDIDYMKDYETFTIDQERFPLDRMAKITSQYHYVPIIQPSIRFGKGYAYQQGKKRNIFIKDAEGVNDQIGRVWAGDVVFTDYFHPNSTKYWIDMLQNLHKKINFTGIWLDMNQISNLCNGPCTTPTPSKSLIDYTNDIPYHPGNDTIQTQAIPLNATHYGNNLQANVHTYFGFMETYATYFFLYNRGMPFIITRSNTLGSNRYGFHWTGDNYANYQYLRTSISSNFMFSFWGIHMVGSDICGFGGNATDQLCARWFQLGSLYPFARNHNELNSTDQQPYALGQLTLTSSIKNLKLRYSILKHYYRQFIISTGLGAIFKPLFFQFPGDDEVFKDEIAQTQFMIGGKIMSAPLVEENKNVRQVYFPNDTAWCDWFDFHQYKHYPGGSRTNITNKPNDLVPLYIRAGSLIFTQNVQNVTKTSHLTNLFTLFGAYNFNTIRSNDTYKMYESFGGVLSIKDYNNQTLVEQCIKSKCDYSVSAIYEHYSSGKKSLRLGVHHTGQKQVTQQIVVNEVKIYTIHEQLHKKLANPITFTNNSITLTIYLSDSVEVMPQ